MNIQELENKHFRIPDKSFCSNILHRDISIQFAIEILEELSYSIGTPDCHCEVEIYNKIEELKKYL